MAREGSERAIKLLKDFYDSRLPAQVTALWGDSEGEGPIKVAGKTTIATANIFEESEPLSLPSHVSLYMRGIGDPIDLPGSRSDHERTQVDTEVTTWIAASAVGAIAKFRPAVYRFEQALRFIHNRYPKLDGTQGIDNAILLPSPGYTDWGNKSGQVVAISITKNVRLTWYVNNLAAE